MFTAALWYLDVQAPRHQGGQGGHGPPTFLLGNYFLSCEYFHFNLRNTKIETKGEKYINATIFIFLQCGHT